MDLKKKKLLEMEEYLHSSKTWFWNTLKNCMQWKPTISGYITTRNCISQNYPFESSISSLLDLCDEVIVMDGTSTDGTYEKLKDWGEREDKLKVFREELDWDHPRFAIYDGMLKDLARQKCSMDFCFQIDADEILHESDTEKYKVIANQFPTNVDLLALPELEYWGSKGKVRIDVSSWKWRLSRNKKHIGHGVPKRFRKYDENGDLYIEPVKSDGCDYIHRETGDPIQFANFYTMDVEMLKRQALSGNKEALENYEKWINAVVDELPTVFHYSWWNIERKIKTYRGYWARHWRNSLYNLDASDTPENNVMFNKSWSEVSDEEIRKKAKELEEMTGGWIFHSKWNGERVPHISCKKEMPKYIKDWAKANK